MTKRIHLLSLVLLFGAHRVSAQSLALAPAQVQYTFKPGQPFQFDLGVSNNGPAAVVLKTSLTDLWYNDKNEKTFDRPGTSARSAANWIEVVPPQITVPAGGTGTVNVVVTPPAKVSGGYYAVVFLESKPELAGESNEEHRAIFTNIRLGCLILLNAATTDEYGIDVSDIRMAPPDPSRPLKLDFQLANKSNTHIFPETKVAILDSHQALVAKAETETKRFLPQQSDRLSLTWAGNLPPGDYTAILTVVYGSGRVYTKDVPFKVPQSEFVRAEPISSKTPAPSNAPPNTLAPPNTPAPPNAPAPPNTPE